MAFTMRAALPTDVAPELGELVASLREQIDPDLQLDDASARALSRGERGGGPWPKERVGLYVPGASTRGAELSLTPEGGNLALHIHAPALCTWTDWTIALEVACRVAPRSAGGIVVPGEGRHDADALRAGWLDEREPWEAEVEQGYGQLLQTVHEGKLVRIGGPAGFAVIGPRVVDALQADPPDDRPFALLERMLDSIAARGFEDFHPAALLLFDGSDGSELVASVLAPDRSTLLRDPEFILLSDDLEAARPELRLLPFARLDDVFPARATWLDDRTAAIPAIGRGAWPGYLERARPLTSTAAELLDRGARAAPPRPPWWRFWDRG